MVAENADNSGPGIRVCRSSTSQQLKREEIGCPTFLLREDFRPDFEPTSLLTDHFTGRARSSLERTH